MRTDSEEAIRRSIIHSLLGDLDEQESRTLENWLKTPEQMTSWEFFDYLLEKAHIVGTPGSGFGAHGEGYFRLTAFGSYENTLEAIERIKNL